MTRKIRRKITMKKTFLFFLILNLCILSGQKNISEEKIYRIVQSNPSVIQFIRTVTVKNRYPIMYTENEPVSDGYYEIYVGEKNENSNAKFNSFYYYPDKQRLFEYNVVDDQKKITDYNLAILGTISVDSSYPGYKISPLTDSIFLTEKLKWNEAAWASAEKSSEHYIKIKWKSTKKINRVVVYWALDKGEYFISKNINLSSLNTKEVLIKSDKRVDTDFGYTSFDLSKQISTDTLIIKQPVGGGSDKRPNLLWVREICVY
jgi:hypothetical protein